MISREEALQIVSSQTESKNLVKHMLAVEAAMGGLAKHFNEDENLWKTIGLIHDADYEKYPDKHPLHLIEQLEEKFKNNLGPQEQATISAIRAHAWGYNGLEQEPKGNLEWSLYCCDELTGLIVAVALVKPDKKLASVTVESVKKKWPEKSFAAGVKREQIAECETRLGIPLDEFIQIALTAMQGIAQDLGL